MQHYIRKFQSIRELILIKSFIDRFCKTLQFFNISTGIFPADAISEGKFFTTFLFILAFYFVSSIFEYLENLAVICSILLLLLTDSLIYSKRFSDSTTDSKYILKVLAILWFSKTILSFSINVNLEPPCEFLFKNYDLEFFLNGLVNLSKYFLLHLLFILTTKLHCFLWLKISTALRVVIGFIS